MPTVLITGASSGIGRAVAERFFEDGWNVVAAMRTPAESTQERLLHVRLDVRDEQSIEEAISVAVDRFGKIDVVVNNAGYGLYGPFEAIPAAKARDQFDVNVFGVMNVMRAVLPEMRARRAGVIVNVSSGAGLYALPLSSLYCASKFALEGFSESVAYELEALGIRVKLVIPHGGVTQTNFASRSGLEEPPPLEDYEPYQEQFAAAMARMPAPRSITATDVASVVFQAATDTRDRLRYLVGEDTRGFVAAWDTLTNSDYLAFMRRHFSSTADEPVVTPLGPGR